MRCTVWCQFRTVVSVPYFCLYACTQCAACEERRSSSSHQRGSAGAGRERYSKERKLSGKVSKVLVIVHIIMCMIRVSVHSAR
jgi:hypothetical protein